MNIRPATLDDRPAILEVVRAAFSNEDRDAQDEVDIVEQTWALHEVVDPIELVAINAGDQLVGHVLAAAGRLTNGHRVLAAAPLGVHPSSQGQGIGSGLMTELLRQADEADWPLVLLLGDPAYYFRFGFEPSTPLGIVYRPVGADSPYFQARRLKRYDPSYRGDFTYCWEQEQAPAP